MCRKKSAVLLCLLLTIAGCAVRQLQKDQDEMRVALLNLYTNQIIDNLIRAHNGMPIIQLDYSNATGTVTCEQTTSVDVSQEVTKAHTLLAPLAASREILTKISGTFGTDNTNQVAVTATPVTTSNEVYDAYLEFLSLPGSLVVSCNPPPPCTAHICRKCGNTYYWVPVEYQKDFFRLSLLTTAQRGKSLFQPDSFYTVSIQDVTGEVVRDGELPPGPGGSHKLLVKLDKKVPNDTGYMKVVIDDSEVQYNIGPYADLSPNATQTDIVTLYFDPKAPGSPSDFDLAKFKGHLPLAGRLFLRFNQPKPPTTDDLLQRANFQLQQIHFDQLRTPSK